MAEHSEIKSIIKWLEGFPEFNATFDISHEDEDSEQVIDFLGTETLETTYYLRIGMKERFRNDYVLQVAKPAFELLQRQQNADFLVALQKWVADQSAAEAVPKLGNYGRQRTWVDAQQFVELDESDEHAIYQIQMHIEYTVLR